MTNRKHTCRNPWVWTPVSCVLMSMILGASALFLGSCGEDGTPPRETVTLQLDWKPGAEHAFLYLGKKRGFFEKAGIDLQIVAGTGSSDSANMVNAKTVDFALCSGESALAACSASVPRRIMAIAVFYPNTPTVIYSLKQKAIEKPEGLYGKRLGVMKTSSAYRNYVAFAEKYGLDRSQIEEIPCTGDLREITSDSARLDAMVHFEFQHPLQIKLHGEEVTVIPLRSFGIKIYGQSLVTHVDMVEKRSDLVQRFTKAVQESYAYCIGHPDEATETFLAVFPEQDARYARAKLEWVNDFVVSGIPADKPIGYHDENGWSATKEYLSQQGLLDRDVAVTRFATSRFLDPSVRPVSSPARKDKHEKTL